ncbi:hypothetical protein WH50_03125 [Pokkaliibacter plantistimulans]|uniref:Uncharacterized protein n=1 Tax=Pokkaliibacter plantistimulans TaxID=1635171 RepID=A0ABX5M741_9GAMM|nr:hypothetical protein WH50_03125 [Pokkaliibacter plantistimulans]
MRHLAAINEQIPSLTEVAYQKIGSATMFKDNAPHCANEKPRIIRGEQGKSVSKRQLSDSSARIQVINSFSDKKKATFCVKPSRQGSSYALASM